MKNQNSAPPMTDFKDVMPAHALADQRHQARHELDEKIVQGLEGPFLTEEEWRRALKEMRQSIPESARDGA